MTANEQSTNQRTRRGNKDTKSVSYTRKLFRSSDLLRKKNWYIGYSCFEKMSSPIFCSPFFVWVSSLYWTDEQKDRQTERRTGTAQCQ